MYPTPSYIVRSHIWIYENGIFMLADILLLRKERRQTIATERAHQSSSYRSNGDEEILK